MAAIVMGQVDSVREFVEDSREKLHDELRLLDEIARELAPLNLGDEGKPAPAPLNPPAPSRPRRPGKSGRPSGKQQMREAAERRDAIYNALVAHEGPMPTAAIKAIVPMTQGQAQAAFRKLLAERRIKREGPVTNPTYEAIIRPGTTPPPDGEERVVPPPHRDDTGATDAGRILAYISSTGSATEGGLEEHLDLSSERIRDACGTLIREGEIRHDRSSGVTRYVLDPSA